MTSIVLREHTFMYFQASAKVEKIHQSKCHTLDLQTSEMLHFTFSFLFSPFLSFSLQLFPSGVMQIAGPLKALSVRAVQMAERLDLQECGAIISPSRCLKFRSGVSILVNLR